MGMLQIMMTKRMWVCLATGAALGVLCIIGASIRFGVESNAALIFSLWYNRLLMGMVIGLCVVKRKLPQTIGRGAVLGLIVSFAYYSCTGFTDIVSFLAGIIYGMIIEYIAFKYAAD